MKQSILEFKVEVNDIITPFSCSAMIIEFIKYVIYQKQMIPYPYDRLKMYVNKRKKQLDSNIMNTAGETSRKNVGNSKHSLISNRYFKKTEDAHNALENIFRLITEELASSSYDRVEEIVLLLGTSFTNPQDIFRLCIPELNYSHSVKYHSTQKNWRNLFRTLINSEQFNNLLCNNSCTGNLHIMLKMKPDISTHSDYFIPRSDFKLPSRGNHAVISFKNENTSPNCSCNDFKIFEEDGKKSSSSLSPSFDCNYLIQKNKDSNSDVSKSKSDCSWFQMKDTLKYFTDVLINGTSITDTWMNPKLLIE